MLLKEPFDLLIADKNLPGITGLDVIRRAKATDRSPSVAEPQSRGSGDGCPCRRSC